MPPTTGGSTIGKVISPRSRLRPGNLPLASSQATGKPKISAIAVVAREAINDSPRASRAVVLVMTLVILPHGALMIRPARGRRKYRSDNSASPAMPGLTTLNLASTLLTWRREEAELGEHLLARWAEDVLHERLGTGTVRRIIDRDDRILSRHILVGRNRNSGGFAAVCLHVCGVDDARVSLAKRDLSDDRADRRLFGHWVDRHASLGEDLFGV